MKLTVKPRFGMTHVRGGQLLRVSHAHQISTSGYDKRPDAVLGKTRAFDASWVTTSTGDLAMEIIAMKTARVLGYVYLSGLAINVVRYVSDTDRILVGGWFTPAKGIRVGSPPQEVDLPSFTNWMSKVKYVDADVVATTFHCPKDRMSEALRTVARVYSQAPAPHLQRIVTADLIARVQGEGSKDFGVLHFQIDERSQEHACQPFTCDLLLSSSALQDQSFQITCPETFHQCPQSAALGNFGLIDMATGTQPDMESATLTEPAARRLAEQRYPGCVFALSTIGNTNPGTSLPPGMPDVVIIAVLRLLDAERSQSLEAAHGQVVAYVVSAVEGLGCIPFTLALWPDLRDLLPHDHRRESTKGTCD